MVSVAVAAGLVTGVTAVALVVGGGEEPRTVTDAAAVAEAAPECVESVTGDEVSGSGPGSTADPGLVMLAFNHGYYVARSADAAFEAVAESSPLDPVRLQTEGIDRLPEGTTHCVVVRGTGDERLVTVSERVPGEAVREIEQRATFVRADDGGWRLETLRPAADG